MWNNMLIYSKSFVFTVIEIFQGICPNCVSTVKRIAKKFSWYNSRDFYLLALVRQFEIPR